MSDKKDICNAFNDNFIYSSSLFDQLNGTNETLETVNVPVSISEEMGVLSPRQVPFSFRPINHFEIQKALCNSKCMKSSLGADQLEPCVLKLAAHCCTSDTYF